MLSEDAEEGGGGKTTGAASAGSKTKGKASKKHPKAKPAKGSEQAQLEDALDMEL